MRPFAALSRRLRSYGIAESAIRAEVWALGGRHHGRVLEGARLEARTPGLSSDRASLLAAVIRSEVAK